MDPSQHPEPAHIPVPPVPTHAHSISLDQISTAYHSPSRPGSSHNNEPNESQSLIAAPDSVTLPAQPFTPSPPATGNSPYGHGYTDSMATLTRSTPYGHTPSASMSTFTRNNTEDPERDGPVHSKTFAVRRRRIGTNIEQAPVEARYTHDYFFRRPRPLQVNQDGYVLGIGPSGKLEYWNTEKHEQHQNDEHVHVHHTESIHKQRERTDLFVDLLWAGIIANISEHFFLSVFNDSVPTGDAVGEFILLFVPAWRLWFLLQKFLNAYFMDDFAQRLLIVWIMIMGLIWGENSPYFLDNDGKSNFLIVVFVVAEGTLFIAEVLYSFWIKWLRRPLALCALLTLPGVALWILATIYENNRRIHFLTAAIAVDVGRAFLLETPLADRILGRGIRVAQDTRHLISRFESFFLIVLGEGVFVLVRGSPAGPGLHAGLACAIQALMIYYFIGWIYYNGSLSRQYIHAFNRRWWIKWLWQLFHVPLFAALCLLSSGVLYLVEYTADEYGSYSSKTDMGAKTTEAAAEGAHRFLLAKRAGANNFDHAGLRIATATVFISSAIIMFCCLVLSLMHRPLDPKGILLVDSKYIRMLPKAAATAILGSVWLYDFPSGREILGVLMTIVFGAMLLERFAGMGRDAQLFEPREKYALTPTTSADTYTQAAWRQTS